MKKKRVKKTAPEANSPHRARTPTELRRRVILQLAAAILLISVVVVGLFAWGLRPRTLTESERVALTEYEKVRAALADDDLAAAERSAGSLAFPNCRFRNRLGLWRNAILSNRPGIFLRK